MVIIFEEGKNRTLNMVNNSYNEVIELRDNSANHLHTSPINRKWNSLNQTDSWEMFLNENGPHTSTIFRRRSCGYSWANPLKRPFSCKSCNMVLVICGILHFPLLKVERWFQHLPWDKDHWCWAWTSLRLSVSLMAHMTPITIVNTSAIRHVHTINKTKLEIKLESLH